MVESCRMARNRYKIFLDQKKEQKKTSEKEQHAQKLKEGVASCRKKQQSLETESAQLFDKAKVKTDRSHNIGKEDIQIIVHEEVTSAIDQASRSSL